MSIKYQIGDIVKHTITSPERITHYLIEDIFVCETNSLVSYYSVRSLEEGSTHRYYCDVVDNHKNLKKVA